MFFWSIQWSKKTLQLHLITTSENDVLLGTHMPFIYWNRLSIFNIKDKEFFSTPFFHNATKFSVSYVLCVTWTVSRGMVVQSPVIWFHAYLLMQDSTLLKAPLACTTGCAQKWSYHCACLACAVPAAAVQLCRSTFCPDARGRGRAGARQRGGVRARWRWNAVARPRPRASGHFPGSVPGFLPFFSEKKGIGGKRLATITELNLLQLTQGPWTWRSSFIFSGPEEPFRVGCWLQSS